MDPPYNTERISDATKGRASALCEEPSIVNDTRGLTNHFNKKRIPLWNEYVEIVLHRRRSVIVTMDKSGEVLNTCGSQTIR
jgi:hypothetical protein